MDCQQKCGQEPGYAFAIQGSSSRYGSLDADSIRARWIAKLLSVVCPPSSGSVALMTPLPPQKRDELVPAQILIAIALNAVRMITWLAATPHANMRPSRFAARRPRPAPHSSADRGRKSESLASGRRAYFG